MAIIKTKKPLYVVGGFGGAARAVGDRLLGITRTGSSDAWTTRHLPEYDAAVALYGEHAVVFHPLEQIGVEIGTSLLARIETRSPMLSEQDDQCFCHQLLVKLS
jgi:hypothetical protein